MRSSTALRHILVLLVLGVVVICCSVQMFSDEKPTYQTATVMKVKPHVPTDGKDSEAKSYDIYVRIGSTIYHVLYTPPAGTYIVQYKEGMDLPALVKEKTITFNDMLGDSHTLPILDRQKAPSEKGKSGEKGQ